MFARHFRLTRNRNHHNVLWAAVGAPAYIDGGFAHGSAYLFDLNFVHDCNENLVPDGCEIASGASVDCNGNGVADECEAYVVIGDLDGDCDTDLNDFMTFAVCYGGSEATVAPDGCAVEDFAAADLDGDGDVDLNDFLTFSASFTG